MIDKIEMRCRFQREHIAGTDPKLYRWPDFNLAALGVPLEQSIDRDGTVFNTRHPWESIPSSYAGLAFKIFDHRFDALDDFYVEIKASPAKLMQGHNVFGSDDFQLCALYMIELLCNTYPDLFSRLDQASWCLVDIDITYSSRAKTDNEAKQFINALQNVSYGQTKARTGYDGTAYFGKKNSRLKKIKVYAKAPEVKEQMKKAERQVDGFLMNEVYTAEMLEFAKGLIRWEVTLFHRWLERRGISCYLVDLIQNKNFTPDKLQALWLQGTYELFEALKGEEMKIIDDKKIHAELRARYFTVTSSGNISYSKADAVYRTFRVLRTDGWYSMLETMSRATFYRHVKMICECGFSRAALQNMTGVDNGATIIPFVRFIQVDFAAQYPDWHQAA